MRQPAPDQVQAKLKLNAGKNKLLIKSCYVAAGRSYYFAAKPPEQSVHPETLASPVSVLVGDSAS